MCMRMATPGSDDTCRGLCGWPAHQGDTQRRGASSTLLWGHGAMGEEPWASSHGLCASPCACTRTWTMCKSTSVFMVAVYAAGPCHPPLTPPATHMGPGICRRRTSRGSRRPSQTTRGSSPCLMRTCTSRLAWRRKMAMLRLSSQRTGSCPFARETCRSPGSICYKVCACVCVCIRAHVCACGCAYACVRMRVSACVCAYVCTHVHVCARWAAARAIVGIHKAHYPLLLLQAHARVTQSMP